MAMLIEEYRRSPEWRELRPNSQKTYLFALNKLRPLGPVLVEKIKRRHVMKTRDALADTPGMANLVISVFGRLLRFALDREYIEANPALQVRRLKLGEHARWPEAAINYALARLPEHLRRAIVLALYTGQREGDCIRMRWSDYDGQGIQVRQQKTGVLLWIPCHRSLRVELDAWRKEAAAVTILTHSRGMPWAAAESLSSAITLEIKRHPELTGLVFHGLRKAAAARLAEAGCTAHQIMAVTGHAGLDQVEHYTREAEQRINATAAIEKLENFRRRKDGQSGS